MSTPTPISTTNVLELLRRAELRHVADTTPRQRKERGQFFTPLEVARFMARLLAVPKDVVRLLDPGAGLGSLSVAYCERVRALRHPRQVHIDLFETDEQTARPLATIMDACQRELRAAGHSLTYSIRSEDFLFQATTSGPLFAAQDEPPYDVVITNPPYFKINKGHPYAAAMAHLVHGQPNIYALFLAAAASRLAEGGAMVAITPRSFCNGLYFRSFRQWFFDRMSLDHVHLFGSRTDTFREAAVLQESVITLTTRQTPPRAITTLSRSVGRNLESIEQQEVPAERVVSRQDPERMVFLPETDQDAQIVRYAQQWTVPFEGHGLRISTGPVVMFRAKQFLLQDAARGVPLLSAHNVKRFATTWPVEKAKWPLAFSQDAAARKHLLPTRNYVLLKRFSSKEERRRLTASYLLQDAFGHDHVALENHLNYIYHADRELTLDETFGIAAMFNSVFFDRYFRSLSGNTQVNATEVRTLHFPDLATVARIGHRVRALACLQASGYEHIVLEELGVTGSLRRYLEERAA